MPISAVLDRLHGGMVHPRRVQVLASHIAPLIPPGARVLDVGCGDGALAALLANRRPDIRISGVDVLVRPDAAIPVRSFDGRRLPFDAGAFDAALCVDVLHHADSPELLLQEVARVAPVVIVKDHLRHGWLAAPTLRFMDIVGNGRHGVALPFNYLSRREWDELFARQALEPVHWCSRLHLYVFPAHWLFDRGLHFVARLTQKPS